MPLLYDPPGSAELRQGEILANVFENYAAHPSAAIDDDDVPMIDSTAHELVVVMTPDCDLAQDHAERLKVPGEAHSARMLDHVLLCDLYTEVEFKGRMSSTPNSKEWRNISQRQVARFHALDEKREGAILPPLFADFKRHFMVRLEHLYAGVLSGQVIRKAIVPQVYIHDLVHRFYGFLSRVAVDE